MQEVAVGSGLFLSVFVGKDIFRIHVYANNAVMSDMFIFYIICVLLICLIVYDIQIFRDTEGEESHLPNL